jgi:TonB family protein
MRKLLLALLLTAASQFASAKSKNLEAIPYKGTINGNVYTNEFFNMTWEFPKEWTVKEVPTPASGAHYYPLLTLLPTGNQSGEEVSLSAQDFGDTDAFWKTYLDQVKAMLAQKEWSTVGKRTTSYQLGTPSETEEYSSPDGKHFVAIVAAPLHRHEVKGFVSAPTQQRLQDLLKTLDSVKVIPDWDDHHPLDATAEPLIVPSSTSSSQPPTGVTQGKLIKKVPPYYPPAARTAGITGTVTLWAQIGSDGNIHHLYILQGPPLLVGAAVDAISQWRYSPYALNGKPIVVLTEITINFTLSDAKYNVR